MSTAAFILWPDESAQKKLARAAFCGIMFYGELMRHDHEQKKVRVIGKAEYGNCFSREEFDERNV
jgi:hypothetical protein